ncbi:hypothetical protein [Synechococcus sp. CCY 0621]|uniref:hypothetical protein n=1 Tax=Synechococcus sp. CCY 0621 TaxID=2815603 RepID=UPI001C22DA93|nr:hypothetical protein [Synechococcus sp. CCY 0621]
MERVNGSHLSASELNRRGIAASEEALQRGPVHLMKRIHTAAVVLSESHYLQLCQRASLAPEVSALEWLVSCPAAAQGRTKKEIDGLKVREPWVHGVKRALAELAATDPGMGTAVSRLSWMECRVGPLRRHDPATLATFDAFFSRTDLIWLELTAAVFELATDLRGRHSLRTPVALQVACCLQLGGGAVMNTRDPPVRKGTHFDLLAWPSTVMAQQLSQDRDQPAPQGKAWNRTRKDALRQGGLRPKVVFSDWFASDGGRHTHRQGAGHGAEGGA